MKTVAKKWGLILGLFLIVGIITVMGFNESYATVETHNINPTMEIRTNRSTGAINLFPQLVGDDQIIFYPLYGINENGVRHNIYTMINREAGFFDFNTFENRTLTRGRIDFHRRKNGLPYLLQNIGSHITYDTELERYYKTQVAIWLYAGRRHGNFFTDEQMVALNDVYFRHEIETIVEKAVILSGPNSEVFNISSPNSDNPFPRFSLDESGYYLESNDIQATWVGSPAPTPLFDYYQISFDHNLGIYAIDQNRNRRENNIFSREEMFRLRIPLSSVDPELQLIRPEYSFIFSRDNTPRYALIEPGQMITADSIAHVISDQIVKNTWRGGIFGENRGMSWNMRIPTGSLNVKKISNETNQLLSEAEVVIRRRNDREEIKRFRTTDEETSIDNLLWGYYEVSVTDTPEGYNWNEEPVIVRVDDERENYIFNVTLRSDREYNEEDEENLNTDMNGDESDNASVPDTLSNQSIIFILLGVMLIVVGTIVLVISRKKKINI